MEARWIGLEKATSPSKLTQCPVVVTVNLLTTIRVRVRTAKMRFAASRLRGFAYSKLSDWGQRVGLAFRRNLASKERCVL